MRRLVAAVFAIALVAFDAPARSGVLPRVGVIDLESENVPRAELRILSDRLRVELVNTGAYRVLERERMDLIPREQGFQQSGCVATECVVEIGELLGAQKMIGGRVGRIGDVYTITVRMVNVETGAVERSAVHDCACPLQDVLIGSVPQVAAELAGRGRVRPAYLDVQTSRRGAASEAVSRDEPQRENTWTVSFGASYGRLSTEIDGYNSRLIEQNQPRVIDVGGTFITLRIREPIESPRTFFGGTSAEYHAEPIGYLFEKTVSRAFAFHARLRHRTGIFALVETGISQTQKVGSARNFGGQVGYEEYEVKVTLDATVWLGYHLRLTRGWPALYAAAAYAGTEEERTTIQVTSATGAGWGSNQLVIQLTGPRADVGNRVLAAVPTGRAGEPVHRRQKHRQRVHGSLCDAWRYRRGSHGRQRE